MANWERPPFQRYCVCVFSRSFPPYLVFTSLKTSTTIHHKLIHHFILSQAPISSMLLMHCTRKASLFSFSPFFSSFLFLRFLDQAGLIALSATRHISGRGRGGRGRGGRASGNVQLLHGRGEDILTLTAVHDDIEYALSAAAFLKRLLTQRAPASVRLKFLG